MQENERKQGEMPENQWDEVEKHIASEIINAGYREKKAIMTGTIILSVSLGAVIAGLIMANHSQAVMFCENDKRWQQTVETMNQEWIDYLSGFDFVSQDGEGINYYNADIGGDVNNGAAGETEKEPE